MVTLVPNIVVLRYLRGTQRKDPKLEAKALKFISSGYQRELTYLYSVFNIFKIKFLNFRRQDNSFSAFGQSDNHGSVQTDN
jgi:hypothetical protein